MHAQTRSITVHMLALPIEVLCGALLPHLSVCDLQALDTAFTNKYLRPQLQQVWKSYQYDSLRIVLKDLNVRWFCGSGVQIISVATETFPSAAESVLPNISTLKRLRIESIVDSSLLLQLAINSPDLEELSVKCVCGANTDNAISALALNCRQLHTLNISSEELTDAGIQALCYNCLHLKHIGLLRCRNLTNTSLIAIANTCWPLEYICLCSDEFTDNGLIYIADRYRELRSVSVRYCDVSSRGLTALWAANPHLMDVDISGNEFISDDDIIQLVQCCPLLQKLNVSYCDQITDAAVIAVAEHCPQLRLINICWCKSTSDASLIALGQHCHDLMSINISYNTEFSDVGIAALAAGCPLLQEFYSSTTRISSAGVVSLARGCRDLRKVTMMTCKSIGDAAVSAIVENCPLICALNFQSCKKIKDSCLYVIAQHCRNLTYLEIDFTDVSVGAAVLTVMPFCQIVTKDMNTMRDLQNIRSSILMSLFNGQSTFAC